MLHINLRKYVATPLALALGIFLSSTTNAQESNQPLPLDGVELNIGLNYAPPFVSIDGSFTDLSGIDVDIIHEMQRRTGFKLKRDRFHMMSLASLMDLTAKGELDLIAGVMSINDDRSKIYTQSPGLFRSNQAVIVPAYSNINSIHDLAGMTVAAESGSNSTSFFPAEIANTLTVHDEVSTFMLFYAVSRGQADALVTEEPIAQAVIDNWGKGKFKIVQRLDSSISDFGYMMKKDSKVSQVLHDTLLQMREDGTIANIVQKYLPTYEFPSELYSSQMRIAAAKAEEKAKALRQAANNTPAKKSKPKMNITEDNFKLPKENNTPMKLNEPNLA